MSTEQDELWARSAAALAAYRPAYSVELVVPELNGVVPPNEDGEPVMYSTPWDTADAMAIERQAAADDPMGWIDVLIRKARDERGRRIFHVAHRAAMINLPHDTLRRCALAIMTGTPDPKPVDDDG